MITDHMYATDYAGLDPTKQICNFPLDSINLCARPRSEHLNFVGHSDGFIGQVTPDEFEWFDHCDVNMIESTFSDDTVCFAAWTSTKGDDAGHDARKGLINRLMKDRHGTPFEHMWIQFQVTAPIFVWREHHRHRMASYNEESARYRTMRPRFYIPPPSRPMVQVEGTKAMDYIMSPPRKADYDLVAGALRARSAQNYKAYQDLLGGGIVREVARMLLPVNLMSTCIVTMNARGLMNFLSLRVKSDAAVYPTNPQWEINQVALEYERHFAEQAPLTYTAFIDNGRVCP